MPFCTRSEVPDRLSLWRDWRPDFPDVLWTVVVEGEGVVMRDEGRVIRHEAQGTSFLLKFPPGQVYLPKVGWVDSGAKRAEACRQVYLPKVGRTGGWNLKKYR